MADTAAEASAIDLDEEPGESPRPTPKGTGKRVSMSLRSLAVGAVIVALVLATAVMAWLYFGERSVVSANQQRSTDRAHAEQIALDYAVNAAAMSYQKMPEWKDKLVAGTSQNLRQKLTEAATSMEQLLVPLEWSSTAKPLAAKVRSEANGVYVVDTFVSVRTKTTQTPDNLQSTATYSITVDGNAQWQITDVGGIGNVLGSK